MTAATFFKYTVNGVTIESRYEKLTASEILEKAKEHGAIEDKPENYILQSLTASGRKYLPHDTVDLSVDHEFIALHEGPTPVA